VWVAADQPDRRAQHRAAAAEGPDEGAAQLGFVENGGRRPAKPCDVADHRHVDAPILQLGQLAGSVHLAQRQVDLGVRRPELADGVSQQLARDARHGRHAQRARLATPHPAYRPLRPDVDVGGVTNSNGWSSTRASPAPWITIARMPLPLD